MADIIYWMLGEIDTVYAFIDNKQHPYIEGEDLGLALIKSKNGPYALFEGTVNVFPKNLEETLYIFGSDGTAKASGKSVNNLEIWEFKDMTFQDNLLQKECQETPPNIYGFGHSRLYANFIEAIENNTKPLISGEEGKKAVELILAIYKSFKTDMPVKLPLDDFSICEMEGTFNGIH